MCLRPAPQAAHCSLDGVAQGVAISTAASNHDYPLLQSLTTNQSLVKQAMVWAFATYGVPVLYYGEE